MTTPKNPRPFASPEIPRFNLRWAFGGITGFCLLMALLAACGASPGETAIALFGTLLTSLAAILVLEAIDRLGDLYDGYRAARVGSVFLWLGDSSPRPERRGEVPLPARLLDDSSVDSNLESRVAS